MAMIPTAVHCAAFAVDRGPELPQPGLPRASGIRPQLLIVHADSLSNRARLIIMSGVLLALLLSALDQTIVSTAMPRIIADLGGLNYYSWVFTSYLLTSTAAMPVFGKLSDLYGRRIFMLLGAVVFLAASALCGLAH